MSDGLYQRKDSPYWWLRFRDPLTGATRSVSTKCRDRRSAKSAAKRIEQQAAAGDHKPAQKRLTLERALELLIESAEVEGKSASTLEIHRAKSGHLLRVFGRSRKIESLTPADGQSYWATRKDEGASPHTVHKELRTLRQAARHCRRLGLYVPTVDPADLMPRALTEGKAYKPRVRWLPLEEYRALLEACTKPGTTPNARAHFETHQARWRELRRAIVAICNTGLRIGELLRFESDDLVDGTLHVKGTKTANSTRQIPLNAEALAAFQGGRFDFGDKEINQSLRAACKRAGIEPVSPNDLRRTFCSWLANAGATELTVIRLMGHSSGTMIREVYAQLSPQALADAIALLPTSGGGSDA